MLSSFKCFSRRDMLKSFGTAALLAAPLTAPAAGAPLRGAKPNILLIVVDDLGYGDLAIHGCPDGETKAMDRFFCEGARFANFYSNGAFCAPTRAALLTGLYPQHAGIWRAPGNPVKHAAKAAQRQQERAEKRCGEASEDADEDAPRGFPEGVTLLPQLLQREGYQTAMLGKWHLGYAPPDVPNTRGFGQFLGFLAGSSPYGPKHRTLMRDEEPYEEEGHLTEIFTNHAIQFLREHESATPFFLYLAYNAPHGPIENGVSMCPEIVKKYTDQGLPQARANYVALVEHLDRNLQRVFDVLRETGLERDTLVVLLSDNGGQVAYEARNAPFRGGKGQVFEGGIHVPCAARWPGRIEEDTTIDARVAAMDWFATLLDIAGIPIPPRNGTAPVSGLSLVPLLEGGDASQFVNRPLFFEHLGMAAAIQGSWKTLADLYGARDESDKITHVKATGVYELYNLDRDPGETEDLAAARPEVQASLQKELDAWMRSFPRTRYLPEP